MPLTAGHITHRGYGSRDAFTRGIGLRGPTKINATPGAHNTPSRPKCQRVPLPLGSIRLEPDTASASLGLLTASVWLQLDYLVPHRGNGFDSPSSDELDEYKVLKKFSCSSLVDGTLFAASLAC